ncbi:MAG: MBL fold metallo-hydrolase [Chitinivibrionales bacterium]|nr:MBL fold metallo-hydrolase [Chitinivibrionales bacterium]
MHLTVIRSGSSGNCSLVEHESTKVLIDAGGQSQRGMAALFDESGVDPAALDAIIVSHLHRDHCNTATIRLAQRMGIPLWMHKKNTERLPELYNQNYRNGVDIQAFTRTAFTVGSLTISAFGVSHDAMGNTCGFRVHPHDAPHQTLAYAADLGHVPPEVAVQLLGVDTLFLEANHDLELLWANPRRTYRHKKRVTGCRGHLSNQQCAEAIIEIVRQSNACPARIILGHLSADHNSPQLALDTVGQILENENISTDLVSSYRDRSIPRYQVGTANSNPRPTPPEQLPDQLSLF